MFIGLTFEKIPNHSNKLGSMYIYLCIPFTIEALVWLVWHAHQALHSNSTQRPSLFYKIEYHNAEYMGPRRHLPVLSVTYRLILFYFWTFVCVSLPWTRWYHLGVPLLQPDPRGLESYASLLQPAAAVCFSADCALAATIVALLSPWAFVPPPGFH